ncbi:MAG: hypothetical protein QGM45_11365, partial [Anaerolineales bacterium]|nr:hypothetical protein [Anaerolineales bacterium]
MAQVWEISDGSSTVDLINASVTGIDTVHEGYSRPNIDLGLNESGRIVERWRFVIKGSDQDNAASQLQSLIKLIRKAKEFQESIWRTKQVYLKQQAKTETNARFALIFEVTGLQAIDPFAASLEENSVVGTFQMTIVREHPWRSGAPGVLGSALTLDASDGPASPTLVHVANFRDNEDADSIYVDDGGVFSSNRASTAAFDLFPSTPVANDALYVGSAAPWKHIIFNLGTAANWNVVIAVEYYDGTSFTNTATTQGIQWTSFNKTKGLHDANDLFDTTGQWAFNWFPPSNWATVSVNSQTKYWVRFRLSTVTSSTAVPANATVEPYSQSSPHVAIPAASIKGDSPPLFNIR